MRRNGRTYTFIYAYFPLGFTVFFFFFPHPLIAFIFYPHINYCINTFTEWLTTVCNHCIVYLMSISNAVAIKKKTPNNIIFNLIFKGLK